MNEQEKFSHSIEFSLKAEGFLSSAKRISKRPKNSPQHDLLLLRFRVNIHTDYNYGGGFPA